MCHFSAQNGPFVLNNVFLVQIIIITCIYLLAYLLAFFIALNLKKLLTGDPELWRSANFGPNMVHFPKHFFFGGKIVIIFIYLLAPFIVPNLLKSLTADPPFFVPKWATSPNDKFFRKPVNEPCYFHSCLYACQKSKSDINLLMKHWRLKKTEMPLADSHFWL